MCVCVHVYMFVRRTAGHCWRLSTQCMPGISQHVLHSCSPSPSTFNTYVWAHIQYMHIHIDTFIMYIYDTHLERFPRELDSCPYSSFIFCCFIYFANALLAFLYSLCLSLSVLPAWSSAVRSLGGRFCLAVLRTHVPWRKDRLVGDRDRQYLLEAQFQSSLLSNPSTLSV